MLAVVGRPNVGKSTLVNRILGSRQAVVQDVPGVTRDRVAYDANWRGRTFTVVDTGGWEARAQGLSAQVAEQAKIAVDMADAVLFVVDARVGATDEDEAVANVLRRSGKPVVLAANKVDDAQQRGRRHVAVVARPRRAGHDQRHARPRRRRPARPGARRAARGAAGAAGARPGRAGWR